MSKYNYDSVFVNGPDPSNNPSQRRNQIMETMNQGSGTERRLWMLKTNIGAITSARPLNIKSFVWNYNTYYYETKEHNFADIPIYYCLSDFNFNHCIRSMNSICLYYDLKEHYDSFCKKSLKELLEITRLMKELLEIPIALRYFPVDEYNDQESNDMITIFQLYILKKHDMLRLLESEAELLPELSSLIRDLGLVRKGDLNYQDQMALLTDDNFDMLEAASLLSDCTVSEFRKNLSNNDFPTTKNIYSGDICLNLNHEKTMRKFLKKSYDSVIEACNDGDFIFKFYDFYDDNGRGYMFRYDSEYPGNANEVRTGLNSNIRNYWKFRENIDDFRVLCGMPRLSDQEYETLVSHNLDKLMAKYEKDQEFHKNNSHQVKGSR